MRTESGPTWVKRAWWMRLVFGTLTLACVGGFVASADRAVLVLYRNWAAGVSNGCLEVGQDPFARQWGGVSGSGFTAVVGQPYTPGSFATAWRPFHAGNQTYSRAMFPLWQPMLVFGVLAGWSHGLLVGVRRSDRSMCLHCGYALPAASASGERRCPECGHADERRRRALMM